MRRLILLLSILVIICSFLYLGFDFFILSDYLKMIRLTKFIAYLSIALLTIPSTIAFQTVINSRYLSPGILGIDTVYVLLQSLYYFIGVRIIGNYQVHPLLEFIVQMSLMVLFFILTITFGGKTWFITINESIWLMVGLIAGTVLRSFSTFFQVLMDPNEYLKLQSKLFPSFQAISRSLLIVAVFVAVGGVFYLYNKRKVLDAYHLGKERALTLGIDIQKETIYFLFIVILMVGTSTAVVGPLTFLGFMVANLTYYVTPSHQHRERFIIGILFGMIFIIFGQYLVERVFNYQYNLSMLIEGIGGVIFFIVLIRKEKGRFDHY